MRDRGDGPPLRPLTGDGDDGHVVDRILEVALAQPDALAVCDATGALSFGALVRLAAGVTAAVRDAAPDGRPVAVLRGHGCGAVVAALGVIASGAPLVVLDPTTPVDRLRHYVESAGASLCVTDAVAAVAAAVCATTIDADSAAAGGPATLEEAARVLASCPSTATDPLLIVYTSGSTGRPKGVACDSRSVVHDAWTNGVGTGCYGRGDVVANLLPMAFSAGIGLTFAGLLLGATQHFFDPRSRSVAHLPEWLRGVGATVLVASPGILRGVVAAMPPGARLDGLRMVTMAGETVHGAELAAVRSVVGEGCEIRNRYGSTETWLIAQFVVLPDDPAPTGATPVGWPVPGVRVRIQDVEGALHDHGTGRLVVTSRWLSSGYWGDREGTAAVLTTEEDGSQTFLTSDTGTIDEQGCIRLLGRTDHSVKVGGQLVEPGEVDAVLFSQPEIREAVVVGVTSPTTRRARLVAYVVPAAPRLQAASVRRAVRDVLPGFMVPQQVVFLTALPRTERGKLDRSALPAPPESRRAGALPRTDWERVVAGHFARVLAVEEVGRDDDFFELGGDSLAAEALLAGIGDLGVEQDALTTGLLAEAPTVACFAEAVRRRRRSEHPTLVVLRHGGGRRPLWCLAGAGGVAVGFLGLAQRLRPDQPVLALQAHGLENRGLPDWSVEAAARRHLATVRTVQPNGPYRLAGHSLGAVIALELARQLRAAGETVEQLFVLDSFPPDPTLNPPVFEGGPFRRTKAAVALLATGLLPDRRLGHYLRFHRQGMFLQRRHHGTPWDGRTLVFVARDDEYAAVRARWADFLTGPWSLREVAGDHVGMLHEPNVAVVAEAVQAELDQLDRLDELEDSTTA